MIKWVARLALLTVLLGLAGTILILKNMNKNEDVAKIKGDEKNRESVADEVNIKNDAIKPVSKQAGKISPATVAKRKEHVSTLISQENKENGENTESAEAAKIKANATPRPLADIPQNNSQDEQGKDQNEKLLSQEELQHLQNQINATKEENQIYSNCVQIYATTQSAGKRIVSQVETYLRSERFSIAGRETISKKVKGIQVTAAGGCIRVTIGSF